MPAMRRVRFIHHGNKEILLLDLSNCGTNEALGTIEDAIQLISTRPAKSMLTLTDVTNTRLNHAIGERIKQLTMHKMPFEKAGAVVGMTGLKKIIFGAVMTFTGVKVESFDDQEQAKSWLAGN